MKYCYTVFLCFLLPLIWFGAAAQAPMLAADINPGAYSSIPGSFTPFNGKLLFIAHDKTVGRELWSYSGTGAPALVNDLNVGTARGINDSELGFRALAVFGSKLYFNGSNGATNGELYAYDGVNGPALIADLSSGGVASNPRGFTVMGGKLFFTAYTSASGTEMFSYDGVNPPVPFDIRPGAGPSTPAEYTVFNGKLYFSAWVNDHQRSLFYYDPITDSVTLAPNLFSSKYIGDPYGLTVAAGKLWFAARTADFVLELYSYDGRDARQATDLGRGQNHGVISYGVGRPSTTEIASLNGMIYFAGVEGGYNTQLYRYDPATGKTILFAAINPSGNSSLKNLTAYKGRLYFQADNGINGAELWMTDGTTTSMVADIWAGSSSSNPIDLAVWNGELYMGASDSLSGNELYRLHDATGITAVAFNGSVQLYPNPARELVKFELTLPMSETISIEMYDVTGKMFWSRQNIICPAGKTVLEMPLRELSSGTYFYRLSSANGKLLVADRLQKQ